DLCKAPERHQAGFSLAAQFVPEYLVADIPVEPCALAHGFAKRFVERCNGGHVSRRLSDPYLPPRLFCKLNVVKIFPNLRQHPGLFRKEHCLAKHRVKERSGGADLFWYR